MKITDHIKNAKGKTQFTFEILPPVKGHSINTIFDNIDPLMEFNPPFIDVTSHASTVSLNKHGKKTKKKKRPGTISICGIIQNRFNIDTVAHLACNGFTKEETEDALIELSFLGIENILAISGDGNPKEITVAIGPEGGFTDVEKTMAIDNGYSVIQSGPRLMRTETAPIMALSILQYLYGDLSN